MGEWLYRSTFSWPWGTGLYLGVNWNRAHYYWGHYWPIYQPRMMDDDECGAMGGMIGRGNRGSRRPAAMPLRPPQIPYHLTRARTRADGKPATNHLSYSTAFVISWRWVASFTLLPLYPQGNSLWYPLHRRLVGPLDDMEKWKFMTVPGLETRSLSRPARSRSLYRLNYRGS
jgi:hypothetical protein